MLPRPPPDPAQAAILAHLARLGRPTPRSALAQALPHLPRESVMVSLATLLRSHRVVCSQDHISLPALLPPQALSRPPAAPVSSTKRLADLLARPVVPVAPLAPSPQHPPSDLTHAQLRVLDLVSSSQSVFFTGPAGSGKSHLLKILIEQESRSRTVFVTAPTGMAACLIGGTTINSWAGIGLGKEDAPTLCRLVASNKHAVKRWRSCSLLVIDEVSMLDSQLFSKLDQIGQAVRNSTSPFGGIQLALCGDFFQLPPVGLSENCGFCFQSPSWGRAVDHTVLLTQVFRQNSHLSGHLNSIRLGRVTPEFAALVAGLSAPPAAAGAVQPTRLYARNADADRVNQEQLAGLRQPVHSFKAKDWCQGDRYKSLLEHCPAPSEVHLAVGAQVVLLCNLRDDSGLVNGSRGVVVGFEAMLPGRTDHSWESNEFHARLDVAEQLPLVKFASLARPRLVARHEWTSCEGDDKVASRCAVPLKLAWALSIHKSQGMTIDVVQVDLRGVFEFGQAYVALSRCSTLQGLSVVGFQPELIRAHPAVVDFYRELEEQPQDRTTRQDEDDKDNLQQEDEVPWLSNNKRPKRQ